MNKKDILDKIKSLEGLSNDERAYLVNLVNTKKKYGLVWENKPEEVEEQLREYLPVLKEVKDKAIINGEEHPNHILIEGDNLHALTALTFTHENKIDLIYIDPPYNTGNKDFIYNDHYVDKEDSYRHSKWLSFMHKRLQIAHKLLADDGVIFISIDDNEQSQLKLLCDEIFLSQNFVGIYFWKRTSTPPALSYKIRRKLEHVICYQNKNIPQRTFAQGLTDGGDVPLLNSGNPPGILEFPIDSVRFNIPDGTYNSNKSFKIELIDSVVVQNGRNANKFRAKGNFKWGQNNLDKEVENGTYFLIKSNKFSPRFQKAIKGTKVPSNIIDEEVFVGTNEDAQKEMIDLRINFNYAKPTSLVAYLSKMPFWNNKDISVLDFFAGSGTSLHAIMNLNKEDNGTRQCILVTNNENNIAEEVTYERNKRVIQGYTNATGQLVAGLKNNNLRYYQCDFVEREPSLANKRQLTQLATELLCIKEDCYTEQKINIKQARLFANNKVTLLVLFDDYVIPQAVEFIKTFEAPEIKVYVFSMGSDPYTEDFSEVLDKVTLCALPDVIYKAYQNVLPKKNRVVPIMEEEPQATTNENGEKLSIL